MIADDIDSSCDAKPSSPGIPAANDNDKASAVPIDPRILTIARAIGRQIARERMRLQHADNDNEKDRIDEPRDRPLRRRCCLMSSSSASSMPSN